MIFFWVVMLILNFGLMFANFTALLLDGGIANLFAGAFCGVMVAFSGYVLKIRTE